MHHFRFRTHNSESVSANAWNGASHLELIVNISGAKALTI
jgi:hypothetical protein